MARKTGSQDAELMRRIGARVLIARRRLGISIEELAKRADLHENTVYRVENGQGCSVVVLHRIAGALRVGIEELIPNPQYVVGFSENLLFRS